MSMAEYTIKEPSSGPICDFCSSPRLFARYPARDFVAAKLETPTRALNACSRGDWSACKSCAELIEASRWDALLERSVATFREKYGQWIPPSALRGFIHDLHKQFRENRQPLQ